MTTERLAHGTSAALRGEKETAMSHLDFVKGVYAAFGTGDVPRVLGAMHPQIQWTETAGYEFGGVYRSPQAVLDNVFAKIPVAFESFSIDVDRLIDGGNVVVMQGHYVAKGKHSGKSVRAAVAHAIEISDGKIVRFDQYVDSATINAIMGA
jgi:ketosteroid isomerase-like protein